MRSINEQLLYRNVQRFRDGLASQAHRLCVSLNSRLASKEEEKEARCHEASKLVPSGQVALKRVDERDARGLQISRRRISAGIQRYVPTPNTAQFKTPHANENLCRYLRRAKLKMK